MSPLKSEIQQRRVPLPLEKIARVVKLMDSQFRIPGINITFGLDPLIGLVPGLGDVIDYCISAFLLIAMLRHGASGKVVAKMILNITLDGIVGLIPVAGRIFDFFYKANEENLTLAIDHFEKGKHSGNAASVILPVLGILTGVFILLGVLSWYALKWLWMLLHQITL